MRALRLLVLTAAVAWAVAVPGPAAAGCAAPTLTVVPGAGSLLVSGQGWSVGCQDACACTGGGCAPQRCDCGPPPEPVVQVVLDSGAGPVTAPVDRGRFTADVPAGPGPVVAVGRTADGDEVTVEAPLPGG